MTTRYNSSKFDWINRVGHVRARDLLETPVNGIGKLPQVFEVKSMATNKILTFIVNKILDDHVEYRDTTNGTIFIRLFR